MRINSGSAVRDYCRAFYSAKACIYIKNWYLQLHITGKCRNKCDFCYYKIRGQSEIRAQEMPYELIIRHIDTFRRHAAEEGKPLIVDLIGGDPMLHEDIWPIIDYLSAGKINFGIKGNPHTLNSTAVLKLAEKGLKRFQLSLDGLRDTHDGLRGVPGLFDATISAIKRLNANRIAPIVRYTLSRYNRDELLPLQEFLHESGIRVFLSVNRYVNHTDSSKMLALPELSGLYKKHAVLFAEHLSSGKCDYKLLFKDHVFLPLLHRMGLLDDNFIRRLLKSKASMRCSMFENVYIVEVDSVVKLCQKSPDAVLSPCDSSGKLSGLKKAVLSRFDNETCSNCYYQRLCLGCPAYSKAINDTDCPMFLRGRACAGLAEKP